MNSILDFPVSGTSVLLRCDLNVPIKNGEVLDDSRILASVDTIKYLLSANATVVICSHLGKPDKANLSQYSLEPVAIKLGLLIDRKIHLIRDILSEDSVNLVQNSPLGSLFLLENLRFHPEEEAGNPFFAQQLSRYGSSYVNDAFACCHRSHTSITTIANYLPSFAGLNLIKETNAINSALDKSKKTLCVLGGSKISSKIKLISSLQNFACKIFIAGGMANTFIMSRGHNVGLSLVEESYLDLAREIVTTAKKNGCEIILPCDFIVSKSIAKPVLSRVVDIDRIEKDDYIVDVGPRTLTNLAQEVQNVNQVLWNGPLGVYENPPFECSSIYLARIIAYHTSLKKIISIVGGGDAVACANISGLSSQFSFVSTAGGAFLEYLENSTLPGIEILKSNIER